MRVETIAVLFSRRNRSLKKAARALFLPPRSCFVPTVIWHRSACTQRGVGKSQQGSKLEDDSSQDAPCRVFLIDLRRQPKLAEGLDLDPVFVEGRHLQSTRPAPGKEGALHTRTRRLSRRPVRVPRPLPLGSHPLGQQRQRVNHQGFLPSPPSKPQVPCVHRGFLRDGTGRVVHTQDKRKSHGNLARALTSAVLLGVSPAWAAGDPCRSAHSRCNLSM